MPTVYKRADHCVSRKNIDSDALKVLYRLSNLGYTAYLVGGGVRDLLMGRKPKDFDVGTDASPKEIRRLFSGHCFLVGKRFRLAHVVFGKNIIETSTFRKQPQQSDVADESGLYQDFDNTFGTPEEDAMRRDFTVNGIFYDIATFDVIDHVGGLADLEKKLLRSIGDPNVRFKEDPVRMMRAIRLAAKLGFTIERGTMKAIRRHYREIEKASTPRILEEIFRLFPYSAAEASFRTMWQTRLLSLLMPLLNDFIDKNGGENCAVWRYLAEFDRITAGRGDAISNGFRLAAVYMAPYLAALEAERRGRRDIPKGARLAVAERTMQTMSDRYRMPKSALHHATHLLAELAIIDKLPPADRTVHASKAEQFRDAVDLARIRAAADSLPADTIDAWAKLRIVGLPFDEEEPEQPADDAKEKRKRHSHWHPRRRAGNAAQRQPAEG